MRQFQQTASQGEVNISIIADMPTGLNRYAPEGDVYIIGHSESGNHHVLDRADVEMFEGGKTAAGMQILYALVKSPTHVRQMRDGKPHESIALDAGDILKITPALDYNPYAKAIQRAAD